MKIVFDNFNHNEHKQALDEIQNLITTLNLSLPEKLPKVMINPLSIEGYKRTISCKT